ncbi:uncharacterized protein O3C94_000871 isoform 1-T3 [Discoglossus pictus]
MTSNMICVICCILIYPMTMLLSAEANSTATAMVDVTTMGKDHSVSVSDVAYAPPATTASSVASTTLTTGPNSTTNSSFSQESTTTLSTPAVYSTLLTPATPTKGNQKFSNGSTHLTTFTTRAESASSVTVSVTTYTEVNSKITENKTVFPTQEHSTSQNNFTSGATTIKVDTSANVSDAKLSSLKDSEAILTSIFSIFLGVVVLAVLVFSFKKYRRKRSQYSHHPLRESSFESADRYSAPDDTLVISGGLYDAPRVYNPNMTVLEEDESQPDYVSFSSRPGQFRLEFLPGDKEMDPVFDGSSFQPSTSLRKNV